MRKILGTLVAVSALVVFAATANAAGISVASGTYGSSCGSPEGNVTAHLANACNGKSFCEYSVDYTVIGDPAPGCKKDYVAKWTCGGGGEQTARANAEAGYGSKVELSCQNRAGMTNTYPATTPETQGAPLPLGAVATYHNDREGDGSVTTTSGMRIDVSYEENPRRLYAFVVRSGGPPAPLEDGVYALTNGGTIRVQGGQIIWDAYGVVGKLNRGIPVSRPGNNAG